MVSLSFSSVDSCREQEDELTLPLRRSQAHRRTRLASSPTLLASQKRASDRFKT